mmetsp:Transcript_20585/g.45052  ORF Transcript_20585/g.45052 Transcript_20585/m.45052 type:complete len:260 (+) Transcript_20585:103-882(+)
MVHLQRARPPSPKRRLVGVREPLQADTLVRMPGGLVVVLAQKMSPVLLCVHGPVVVGRQVADGLERQHREGLLNLHAEVLHSEQRRGHERCDWNREPSAVSHYRERDGHQPQEEEPGGVPGVWQRDGTANDAFACPEDVAEGGEVLVNSCPLDRSEVRALHNLGHHEQDVKRRVGVAQSGLQLVRFQDGREVFSIVFVEIHVGAQVDLEGVVEGGHVSYKLILQPCLLGREVCQTLTHYVSGPVEQKPPELASLPPSVV